MGALQKDTHRRSEIRIIGALPESPSLKYFPESRRRHMKHASSTGVGTLSDSVRRRHEKGTAGGVGSGSLELAVWRMLHCGDMREFPKIGDPNIVPEIVGSLLSGPKIRYPNFRRLPYDGSMLGFSLFKQDFRKGIAPQAIEAASANESKRSLHFALCSLEKVRNHMEALAPTVL